MTPDERALLKEARVYVEACTGSGELSAKADALLARIDAALAPAKSIAWRVPVRRHALHRGARPARVLAEHRRRRADDADAARAAGAVELPGGRR